MDSIFKALADPSRRALLDALRRGDGQTLSELEAGLALSRFGVAKHLTVLEAAGLVTRVRRGRFTHHYLNAAPLAEALGHWIEPTRVAPAARGMLDLKARLEAPMDEKPDFVLSTYIRCTPDALWDALTDADQIARHHPFADAAERRGDAIHQRFADGREMLVCRELRLDPKTRIESTFEPRWAPGLPASRVVHLIAVEGDHCRLTVEHYEVPPGLEGVADGWARALAGLKTWLETGEPARFAPEREAAE